ncbi:uncharacterized protein LOC121276421 [Carcharodon carcharias]|uniref:uncharacterized protein LOC121276421 n=1 Tax=Carcharodon carcharias TaxID=13397 RepID=UPI001B7E19E3|nr:uncharacterized protein LOC121276421 [Carcharodon carcharias]
MAATFSQETVLDFLLLHRGKVRNADLTAHFSHFLRDPERQLQTREQFKKFVNSVAVVKMEGGVKYILLKKRYVELIPEEISTSGHVIAPARPKIEDKVRQRAAQCTQPAAAGQLPESPLKQKRQEAVAQKVSKTHRPSRGEEKATPEEFAKLSIDVVQEPKESPKALPTILRGENCVDEANGCTLLSEGSRPQLEMVRENAKKTNVDQPVRQRDSSGVLNKGDGSVLCKSTEQRSRNFKSKSRRGPVAPSRCAGDTLRLFNEDSKRSSNSTASPNLSHLAPPRCIAECREKGKPIYGPPPSYNSEIISDAPVIGNLQYKPDQNLLENFAEKPKNGFQRVHMQGSTSTHQNKVVNHWKKPSSRMKHGSTDKIQNILPVLSTGSDTKVLVNSAAYTEECIQKSQKKLSQQHCQASEGSGQLLGNKGQSISPKRHKPSRKKIKINGLPHKMATVNKSTAPKIVDREAFLHISDQPVSLTQTESHGECREEDSLKIGHASEKSLLDSVEHEWMVKTAVGRFEQAYALFCKDPNFAMKKDFISGYTVLHWIAKHGNHHALSRFISGASKMKVKLNVNIKSTCGYTPLHIAVIHEQLKIIQYLVKKYQANVNLRDHSGKKAWQYLNSESPKDVCQMLGAPEHKHAVCSENSIFLAQNINKQESIPAISRKTSFSALLKSPPVLRKFMHWDVDRFHTIIEDDEQD